MNGSIVAVTIASIAYAIIDVILKFSIRHEDYLPVTIVRSGISVLLLSCFALYFYWHPSSVLYLPKTIDWGKMPMAILMCFISTNGLYFFMKGIKHSDMSKVVGFNKIQVIIAIVFSLTILHQPIAWSKIVAMLLVIAGILLIEYFYLIKHKTISKGLLFIILARICWAFGYLFVPYIQAYGILFFTLLLECVVLCTNIIYYFFSKQKSSITQWNFKSILKPLLLVALLGIVGELGMNYAKVSIPIVLLAFIGLITPIVALILSKILLKEKISALQMLGILLGILGAFIYNF